MAESCQVILSMTVKDAFLRAIGTSNVFLSSYQVNPSTPVTCFETMNMDGNPLSPSQTTSIPYFGTTFEQESCIGHLSLAATPGKSAYRQPPICLPPKGLTYEWREFRDEDVEAKGPSGAMISIQDQDTLTLYYEKAFEKFQQVNCRILAKAYVKLVEPRKQVRYPYNGRKIIAGTTCQFDPDATKPPWWPSRVTHREPDHLPKVERIRLLVHILRELCGSHGISVTQLEKADQSIRRLISPPKLVHVLDEIYYVRRQEEQFLNGNLYRQTMVWVSHADFLETAGNTGQRQNSGNYTSASPVTSPVTIRGMETYAGCAEYSSALKDPQDVFAPDEVFEKRASSQHALSFPNRKRGPREHILPNKISSSAAVTITPRTLKRKRDIVEIHSANPRAPSAVASFPSLSPRAGEQLSMDMYDASSASQPSTVPWTKHSTTGIIVEPLKAYAAPAYDDYRA
ncbi:hypothetical protein N7474_003518 [Penicillium riverlandense]|uniref:uncharacterized protein n=1 Tax=Penicillium riverlandense TaxID=1903569 RepID=UPI0025485AF6|nr:uncharacterized protein N7474_003518 [Penicillium riverlandense]KAJ5826380.1 hypothetical protein N7474_003518 [Penicillium riverlandense]